MAAVSNAAGNWSDGMKWTGGTGPGGVPAATDATTISHNIALDTTAAVCLSLTIASGGTLAAHASNSGKVVSQGAITVNSGGNISADLTGNASQTFDLWV